MRKSSGGSGEGGVRDRHLVSLLYGRLSPHILTPSHLHTLLTPSHAPTASKLGRIEPFAVAHLKLMKEDDTTIQDGEHELFVYKVGDEGGVGGERGVRGELGSKEVCVYCTQSHIRNYMCKSNIYCPAHSSTALPTPLLLRPLLYCPAHSSTALPTPLLTVHSSRRRHVVPTSTRQCPVSMNQTHPKMCPLKCSVSETPSLYARRSAPRNSLRMVSVPSHHPSPQLPHFSHPPPPLPPPSLTADLHRLLHWRATKEEKLPSILTAVTKVPGEEIVKVQSTKHRNNPVVVSSVSFPQFLADTFNALFDIMAENADTVGDLVFEALVRIS